MNQNGHASWYVCKVNSLYINTYHAQHKLNMSSFQISDYVENKTLQKTNYIGFVLISL